MAFTFVHTADWQIGKPFGRFPVGVSAQLQAARLDAIDAIARVAGDAGASRVLVAGDVVDSELLDEATLRRMLGRLAVYPALRWHLLPGNHDPARRGGVWERMARLGLPDNVEAHLQPIVEEIAPGVALLSAPLAAREMRTDPTHWMEAAATPAGMLRIGMAHGSVQGFGSLGEAAVPLDAGRRRSAGLDYLALGDWHGTKEVATGVWYSGTPEPDSFADNGPGHVLVVSIVAPGAPPLVHPVATAQYRWLGRRLVMARADDLASVEEEVRRLGPDQRRHLMSLDLEGAVAAGEEAALDERLKAMQAMLLSLDVDRRGLRVLIGTGDVTALGDGVLQAVATRLAERGGDATTAEGRVAARALRLMLAIAPAGPDGAKP